MRLVEWIRDHPLRFFLYACLTVMALTCCGGY